MGTSAAGRSGRTKGKSGNGSTPASDVSAAADGGPSLADGDGDYAFWLFELTPRMVRLQEAALKDLDPPLTFGQFRLLMRVREGRNTLTAITQAGTLSLPTVSERIEGTVKKGLLRRELDPADRRASRLVLTPLGLRQIAGAEQRLAQISDWLFRQVSETDYTVFKAVGLDISGRVTEVLQELRQTEIPMAELMRQRSE